MSRDKVLQTAKDQLGITESPPHSNKSKYGAWYSPQLDGQMWCAMFVSWVFDHAGHPLGNIQTPKGIHHCQSAHNYYKSKSMLTANPQPGDIVIYDWEGNGHADHIGIFIKWNNAEKTTIEAYEGNTSVGNDSDGGQVMLRRRSSTLVKSFIDPGVYGETAAMIPVDPVISIGARGSAVTQIQKCLFELGYAIVVDGWFGAQTEGFIKEFQKKNEMAQTGRADAVTTGALEEDVNISNVAKGKFTSGSYIRKGNSGLLVTEIQKALNKKDAGLRLPVTGMFADLTFKAVKAFQLKNSLDADGIVGPVTFKALGVV